MNYPAESYNSKIAENSELTSDSKRKQKQLNRIRKGYKTLKQASPLHCNIELYKSGIFFFQDVNLGDTFYR